MKHIRSLILALVLSAGLAPAFAQAPPPVPALPDTERRTSYVISASTCACNVNFQIYQDSTDVANWLKVYLNGVEIPQSGNWNITSPSGSISTLPRPITNAVLTFTTARTGTVQIVGAQRPRRLSEYAENRGVAARDLNQAINGIEAQLREMWDRQFRIVQAPPGETLALLPPLASRVSMGACFDSSGNLAPCVAATGSFIAGTGISFTGVSPTTIGYSGATYSAGAGIVFTGTNPTVISTSPGISAPFIATRAAAIALNLSTYTVIKTGGYATAGDGGGAVFKNVGSAQFLDSSITTGSITAAGSGYTNGTYRGIGLSGGTGNNASATITIAGGVVTGVTMLEHGGNGYTVGDVLTTAAGNIGGTGSGFTWTVSAISAPLASFTDSAGTHWQYVIDAGNFINVRQFGAKFDYNGVDATATDDFASIQAAINFANNKTPNAYPFGLGGGSSGVVVLPHGGAKVCSPLIVYGATNLVGQGMFNSSLKLCDSGMSAASHFVTLCDPNSQQACFGAKIADLTLTASTAAAANNGISMLFSNNVQQSAAVKSVGVYAGLRHCFKYTNGYGGAAKVEIYDFFCTMFTASVNDGIAIDPTTTVNISFNGGLIVEAGGGGSAVNAVNWASGNLFINGYHTEGVVTGILANATVSTYQASLHGATGGSGCTELVKLQATNTLGNFVIGTSQVNGCTRLITNGQPGGANFTANTVKDISCNPGAPCAP